MDNCACSSKGRIKIENRTFSGGVWAAGWLFTVGYLHLAFLQGLLALLLWPYYIGVHFGA